MPANLDLILSRLDRCKPSGKDRWLARCPAHEDRDPSLTVALGDSGRILIHCFAGCGAADVMTAIGLSLADLFPDAMAHRHKPLIKREPPPPPLHGYNPQKEAERLDMLVKRLLAGEPWHRFTEREQASIDGYCESFVDIVESDMQKGLPVSGETRDIAAACVAWLKQ